MTDTTYNGWKNYETWSYRLWLMNDQGSYDSVMEMAREAIAEPVASTVWTAEEAALYTLADMLERECKDSAPDLGSTAWADLLSAAIGEICWEEIARGLIEDVTE